MSQTCVHIRPYIKDKKGGLSLEIEELVVAYGSAITKYCYNLLWDYHEAHDVTQDVFIKANEKLKDLREQAATKTWLYRIAHNICIDILRRQRLSRLFALKNATEDSYEDHYDLGISDELQAALGTLTPQDRGLVYSRAVAGMSYAELEQVYGKKAANLRKRYERAKSNLAKLLSKGEQNHE